MTMIHITLPDGTVNEYAAGITCGEVITDALGKKHGCLAARVDGHECDLSTVLSDNCSVEGILSQSDEGMHILRHSAAHLLAQAVMALYPGALPTIGPAIDRGFYYDFAMDPITQGDLKAIEKKMHEIARRNLTVERVELDQTTLREHFESNPYKLEIIDDKLEAGDGSTIYKQGDWYDLCLGPHVPSTAKLMFVRLTSVSTAYWRGDQDREQLVRIYGMVEPTKEALKATLTRLEEAKSETTESWARTCSSSTSTKRWARDSFCGHPEGPSFVKNCKISSPSTCAGKATHKSSRPTSENWTFTEHPATSRTTKTLSTRRSSSAI